MVVVALAVLATVLPTAAASPSTAPRIPTPPGGPWVHAVGVGFGSWTNGVIDVSFPAREPSLHIVSISDPRVGTTLKLAGVAEIASGNFSAYASFAAANAAWTLTNRTVGPTLDLVFTAVATVYPAQGVWESGDDGGPDTTPLGNATVEVDVYLNQTSSVAADAARVAVNVSTWPWQNAATDALGLNMGLLAAQSTRIAPMLGPGPYVLRELANETDAEVADLSWSTNASVHYANGSQLSTNVTSFSAPSLLGLNSTVRLLFGNVTGGYDAISYDPWVALHLDAFTVPPLPPWVFGPVGGTVIAVGAALVAVLAIGAARRNRAPPDDLAV